MRVMIAPIYGGGNHSDLYAVLEVTGALLTKLDDLHERALKLKQEVPGFYTLTVWESSVYYLESVPEAWVEWVEEWVDDSDTWLHLPFDFDPEVANLCRTEIDTLVVSEVRGFWTAYLKHTSVEIETPPLPDFTPTERLAFLGET